MSCGAQEDTDFELSRAESGREWLTQPPNSPVGYTDAKGVPEILLAIAIAIELLGADSVVVGFRARWGALALLIFLVPVTLVFHNFWAVPGQQQQIEMANFLKNVAIGGGLLIVFARGAGAFSIDSSRIPARAEPVGVTRAAQ